MANKSIGSIPRHEAAKIRKMVREIIGHMKEEERLLTELFIQPLRDNREMLDRILRNEYPLSHIPEVMERNRKHLAAITAKIGDETNGI